ncbi:MAG: hypothetical protein ACYCXL_01460 [Thermoleophilia bacterium]
MRGHDDELLTAEAKMLQRRQGLQRPQGLSDDGVVHRQAHDQSHGEQDGAHDEGGFPRNVMTAMYRNRRWPPRWRNWQR